MGGHPRRARHRRALRLRDVFTERPELRIHTPRSLRLAFSPLALFVCRSGHAPWGEWAAGIIALLILGHLLVDVGYELVCRGSCSSASRPELGALLFAGVLFGLIDVGVV